MALSGFPCLDEEQDWHPLVIGVVDDLWFPLTSARPHPRVHPGVSLLRQGERVVDVAIGVKCRLTNTSQLQISIFN